LKSNRGNRNQIKLKKYKNVGFNKVFPQKIGNKEFLKDDDMTLFGCGKENVRGVCFSLLIFSEVNTVV